MAYVSYKQHMEIFSEIRVQMPVKLQIAVSQASLIQANFDMSNLLISKTPLVSK